LILYQLRDKQAVLAAPDADGGLIKTPDTTPVKNTLSYSLDGKVAEDGALDSAVELDASGDSAVIFRMWFRATAQADCRRSPKLFHCCRAIGERFPMSTFRVLEIPPNPFACAINYIATHISPYPVQM